jgi:hypothetical protein
LSMSVRRASRTPSVAGSFSMAAKTATIEGALHAHAWEEEAGGEGAGGSDSGVCISLAALLFCPLWCSGVFCEVGRVHTAAGAGATVASVALVAGAVAGAFSAGALAADVSASSGTGSVEAGAEAEVGAEGDLLTTILLCVDY